MAVGDLVALVPGPEVTQALSAKTFDLICIVCVS